MESHSQLEAEQEPESSSLLQSYASHKRGRTAFHGHLAPPSLASPEARGSQFQVQSTWPLPPSCPRALCLPPHSVLDILFFILSPTKYRAASGPLHLVLRLAGRVWRMQTSGWLSLGSSSKIPHQSSALLGENALDSPVSISLGQVYLLVFSPLNQTFS